MPHEDTLFKSLCQVNSHIWFCGAWPGKISISTFLTKLQNCFSERQKHNPTEKKTVQKERRSTYGKEQVMQQSSITLPTLQRPYLWYIVYVSHSDKMRRQSRQTNQMDNSGTFLADISHKKLLHDHHTILPQFLQ